MEESEEKSLEKKESPSEGSPLLGHTNGSGPAVKKPLSGYRNLVTFSALFVGYLVVSVAYSIIAPFYPQEAANFSVDSLTVGLIMGASPLCVTIMSPIIGYFIPQLGLKFLVIAGCFLVGGSFILLGFLVKMSTHFEFVLFSVLLRMIEGIGSAGYITASFTIATILYPTKTGTVIGMLELGSGFGFALGPPLGGVLYKVGGFLLPFLVTGSAILAFIPLFIFLLPQTNGMKQYIPPRTLLRFLMDVPFVLLILCNILVVAALGFFSPIMSLFLIQEFSLSEIYIGLVFVIGPAAYMISSIIAGRLTDIVGPRYLIISGLIITGIAFFFIGPAPFIISKSYLWLSCISFVAVGFGIGFGIIPVFTDMLHITRRIDSVTEGDEIYGILSGVSSSAFSLGEFIGPIIGGGLAKVMSFQMSAAMVGLFILAEGLLLFGVTLVDHFIPHSLRTVEVVTN